MFWYKFLDIFFLVFHSCLVVFNLFGWIWKKIRLWNLITLLLTGASWFLLGIFYGWGFCFLTEWHWKVLHRLGMYDLPDSYVQYLIFRVSGWQANLKLVEALTLWLFLLALAISIIINLKSYRSKKKSGGNI